VTPEELKDRLGRFIGRQVGAAGVRIEGLRRMAGGSSRETWSFDAVYERNGDTVCLPLVLRRDPGKTNIQSNRGDEHRLLQAAHAHGVPVPVVHWLADGDAFEGQALLMERVEGETIARRLLRDDAYAEARAVMTAQLAEAAARIHSIDYAKHALDFLARPAAGESAAAAELDRFEQIYRAITPDPHPAFELAFRWLRARLPPANRVALVHGDFRIGNVVFGPEGLRSVLDWELAHVGDPMEDLGWLCVRAWRFGNDDKPVGGIGTREDLFKAYERASGVPVDPRRVRFWEVLGNLKWGIMCIMQAKTHLDGMVRSVELASIGRRTAENELELLNLMEEEDARREA
jgi:aminoglycoside phosphotransferase (APT) family kinase protein